MREPKGNLKIPHTEPFEKIGSGYNLPPGCYESDIENYWNKETNMTTKPAVQPVQHSPPLFPYGDKADLNKAYALGWNEAVNSIKDSHAALVEALKFQASWKMRDGSPCACPAGEHEDEPKGKMPTVHATSCEILRAALKLAGE